MNPELLDLAETHKGRTYAAYFLRSDKKDGMFTNYVPCYRIPDGARIGISKLYGIGTQKKRFHGSGIPTCTSDCTEEKPAYLGLDSIMYLYSDYSGTGMRERANVEVFLARHGEKPEVHEVYGGYGTHGAIVRMDCTDPAVIEDLEILADNPVLDERALERIENEEREKAEDEAIRTFWRILERRYDDAPDLQGEHHLDEWPEEGKRDLFREAKERAGEYFENQGHYFYINAKRIAERVTKSDLLP